MEPSVLFDRGRRRRRLFRVRLLIIEDDLLLGQNLVDAFDVEHDVEWAVDGKTGLRLARTGDHDAIVLDWMLPRLPGIEVCRELRAASCVQAAVLMLTAKDTLEDKLAGFEAGADDFLVKPFALAELDARLRALVRRSRPVDDRRQIRIGDLTLDLDLCVAQRAGAKLNLTRVGFRLLEELMRHSPAVVSHSELERLIWKDHPVADGVLRTHVYGVRRAVDGSAAPDHRLVHTVRGVGYRLGVIEGAS